MQTATLLKHFFSFFSSPFFSDVQEIGCAGDECLNSEGISLLAPVASFGVSACQRRTLRDASTALSTITVSKHSEVSDSEWTSPGCTAHVTIWWLYSEIKGQQRFPKLLVVSSAKRYKSPATPHGEREIQFCQQRESRTEVKTWAGNAAKEHHLASSEGPAVQKTPDKMVFQHLKAAREVQDGPH